MTQTLLRYHHQMKVETSYQMSRIRFSIGPKHDLKLHRSSPKQEMELHALLYPGIAISWHLSANATPELCPQSFNNYLNCRAMFPLPGRPVIRREMDLAPSIHELEMWARSTGIRPGPLIPSSTDRERVLRLFYTYRNLNGNDLTDLPCIDLIVHRVKLLPGTKPISVKSHKKWPAHIEWWLQKLIDDGVKGGIYEHTITANGHLSEWNSRAVLVDKVPNPKPVDEPRLTFAYHQVKKQFLV